MNISVVVVLINRLIYPLMSLANVLHGHLRKFVDNLPFVLCCCSSCFLVLSLTKLKDLVQTSKSKRSRYTYNEKFVRESGEIERVQTDDKTRPSKIRQHCLILSSNLIDRRGKSRPSLF